MNVLIRADASLKIGTGHVHRCLALADVLRMRGAAVRFWSRQSQGDLIELCRSRDFEVEMILEGSSDEEALDHFESRGEILVMDHYDLGLDWERKAHEKFNHLVIVDDHFDREHDCDLYVNPGFGGQEGNFKKLIGPDYALIGTSFSKARTTPKKKPEATLRLLIFYGGVDETGETLKAVDAIRSLSGISAVVVVGATNPRIDQIRQNCSDIPDLELKVAVSNMEVLMSEADLSLGACGAASWERCCLGLPTLSTIVADNQRGIAEGLNRRGAIRALGDWRSVSMDDLRTAVLHCQTNLDELEAMAKNAWSLVDGKGAERVARAIESLG